MERTPEKITRRRFIELLIAAGTITTGAITLGGCAQKSSNDEQSQSSSNADTKNTKRASTVTDFKGREITVPEQIERIGITCMGGAIQEVCVLGGADRVVVMPSMGKSSPLLLKMFPQLEDLPDAGTFDEVNVETLAAAKPDFVFVSSTSDKGNQQVEDIGISTYTLSTAKASVESLRTEFENIGTLLNTSDTAQNLLAFWDDIMSRVDAGAASISESNRLSVYRCGAAITKASHTPWAGNWIRTAGGVSVAEDGTTGDVSVETIAGWNPDIIIAGNPAEILADDRLQDLQAVKNKRVYRGPKGSMGWDAPSPEVPLGFAWLAQTLYPDQFKDIDIEKETKAFYREFYNYELSEEEYRSFFE